MKKIGFIGAYDKTDLMLYIAKFSVIAGLKVLVIDTTINQKAKYVVPAVNPTKSYITTFEDIDIACGFDSFEGIKDYLGINHDTNLNYDMFFIDIDSYDVFEKFEMKTAFVNYFVSSYDMYSLKKGLEVLSGVSNELSIQKVMFSREVSKEEDQFLNYLSRDFKILWTDTPIYFPLEQGDQSAIIENQRVAKLKTKNLSLEYKESILLIVEEILENIKLSELRRFLKNLERGE